MSELSKFQKFEAVTIARNTINNAPYNPRHIDDHALAILKKNIKRVGLIETLVVNKTTMNLVSGHQRLKILDQLHKNTEYSITVAMVELSENEEKEQNIFLNNQNAMGEFDSEILQQLLPEINIENCGFTVNDINIFGIEAHALDGRFETRTEEDKEIIKINEEIKGDSGKTNSQKRKEIMTESLEKNLHTGDVFLIISFDNRDKKREFLRTIQLDEDDTVYIKGDLLTNLLRPELTSKQ